MQSSWHQLWRLIVEFYGDGEKTLGTTSTEFCDSTPTAASVGRRPDAALELDPANQRLKSNLDFFIKRREEVRAGV